MTRPSALDSVFGWVNADNMDWLTDLYELTMADSMFRQGRNDWATYDLFVRRLPHGRAFLVSAGLSQALLYLRDMRFGEEGLAFLGQHRCLTPGFIDYLRHFRFSGDVWAMPEGEVYFPPEPLLRIAGPRIEVQVVESFLLNTFNAQSMWTSKAARITLAAQGRSVIDMSLRRDHGMDAAMKVARASYIAGAAGTSNVLAGITYDIPSYGTMAHAYIMSFDTELAAFRAFAEDCPTNVVLLIDTYDTLRGAEHAIIVAKEMAERGEQLRGVRIDSGDVGELSKVVRARLDAAGLTDVMILLSGDLDEYSIQRLLAEGAEVDSFGVGTNLGTSPDDPSLGAVYKLVEDGAGPRAKLSTGKATLPGSKQVWRFHDPEGYMSHDLLALADETPPANGEPLLQHVMHAGELVGDLPTLAQMRERCLTRLNELPPELRKMEGYGSHSVYISPALEALKERAYALAVRAEG